jgi:Concanavalin A-like lectin/glucanases superfamily
MTRSLLLLLILAPALAAAEGKPAPRLVEGKFGKALDALTTPLAFTGDTRYRTPPLTIECWAKLESKRGFNVLVSSDPKTSSRHWEIYSYAGTGRFSAFLPGYEPSEIISTKSICDRAWHHVAMTFDGKTVQLFVDGKRVAEKAVKPRAGGKPIDGPLSIGMAIDGSARVGCDGAIDEVHLSRVIRTIDKLPTTAPKLDADTIALWRFDGSDRVLADPAWTPPPSTLGEAWERMTDVDWVDGRLRLMDTGPTFDATMAYTHGKERVLVYKGTAIRVGDKGEGGVIFDRNQLRFAAGWTGGFLNQSDRRFGLLNTPTPKGTMIVSSAAGPGYAGPKGEVKSKHPATAPLPREWGRYNGLYMHGKRIVLSYTVNGVEVLESPWLETSGAQRLFTRTFWIGPTKAPLHVLGWTGAVEDIQCRGCQLADSGNGAVVIPASKVPQTCRIYYDGTPINFRDWMNPMREREARLKEKLPDLRAWTKPGPARWTKEIITKGEIAKDTAPYVVDTLTIPYDNPYKALFFCTGFDFLPDGRIAMCTCHGDVWIVSGVDAKLDKLTWKRFATGLYQPLGLKVVDGKIVVLERGQLTRLHAGKNDEAYFYENLCSDWHTGSGEHSYDTCLETDSKGNFYFFKTGDPELPHGGCLMRVSKDGKKVEVFATGFRHPIGLGVGPGDVVTGADQEGNWMPMTRVDVYKKGGFYGDMRTHHRATPPKIYDDPLVWLPKEVDNSAGGQAWVANDRFGLPKGQLLHFSYGRCKLYALLTQEVGEVQQAGAVDLGVTFLSGSARGRFNPRDGHLYVCGLNGWQTAAKRDGCLQRVRFTGQPLLIPTGLSVQKDGIRLEFAERLDAKQAADPKRYEVEEWNYRWSADYGSKRWSVADPKRQGQDTRPIDRVTVGAGGKSVFLQIKGLKPVMQMRIGYDIATSDGKAIRGAIHNTINRVGELEKKP